MSWLLHVELHFLPVCTLRSLLFLYSAGSVVMDRLAFALQYPRTELVSYTGYSNLG